MYTINNKYLLFIFLSVAIIATSACSSAMSKRPVGEVIPKLDKVYFEGIWKVDPTGRDFDSDTANPHTNTSIEKENVVVVTRFKNVDLGILEFQTIAVRYDKKAHSGNIIMRTTSAGLIGNFKEVSIGEKKKDNPYYFFRVTYSISGDYLLIYAPDIDLIKNLVKQGDLKGSLDKDSVIIDELTDTDFNRLKQKGIHPKQLFKSEPVILHRIISYCCLGD